MAKARCAKGPSLDNCSVYSDGCIMAYKGLTLFLDAVDMLRGEGHNVQIGIFGEGALDAALRNGCRPSGRRLSIDGLAKPKSQPSCCAFTPSCSHIQRQANPVLPRLAVFVQVCQ